MLYIRTRCECAVLYGNFAPREFVRWFCKTNQNTLFLMCEIALIMSCFRTGAKLRVPFLLHVVHNSTKKNMVNDSQFR